MTCCNAGAQRLLGLFRLPVCPRRATARLRLSCPIGHVQSVAACPEHALDAREFGAICTYCTELRECDVTCLRVIPDSAGTARRRDHLPVQPREFKPCT